MPETVGLLILAGTGVGEVAGIAGLGTVAGTTIAGVGIATVVGTVAIIGATIGLQYALAGNPKLPKPQDGAQALRQAIPPRQRGYGINRLAGFYMWFESNDVGGPPATSYDVIAFHSGRVANLIALYLSDDVITTVPSVLAGGAGEVQGLSDGSYQIPTGYSTHPVTLQTRLGTFPQTAIGGFPGYDASRRGDAIAHAALACGGIANPAEHSRIYPRGRPELSVVASCSPIWDFRDGAQSEINPATWTALDNPVVQLLDYITRVDGGLGQERAIAVPSGAVLAQWGDEARLCDTAFHSRVRYTSNGWFRYDTSPEDVINSILSTCDGWLSEAGDGSLSVVVGVYRTPTEPPITTADILGFSLNAGQPDEQIVNVFNVSFTDPAQKYVENQIADVRDEASISEIGFERPKPLSLTWVNNADQAYTLAQRAMLRVNPRRSGTLITKLVGLRYLGKRWVRLQYPAVAALADCVVEIQPAPKIDLLNGRVSFSWNLVDPAALLALQ
jgi:hypothetical protein